MSIGISLEETALCPVKQADETDDISGWILRKSDNTDSIMFMLVTNPSSAQQGRLRWAPELFQTAASAFFLPFAFRAASFYG